MDSNVPATTDGDFCTEIDAKNAHFSPSPPQTDHPGPHPRAMI
jgi:hypothetical protein